MSSKTRSFIICLFILVLLTGSAVQPGSSAVPTTYTIPSLKEAWTTGILSDSAANAGIVAADLDLDGKLDIASCNQGYVFIMNYTGSGAYDTIWYSQYLGCLKLTAGDRDSNGKGELYLTTSTGSVVIIDGDSHATLGSFATAGLNGKGIAVDDVDGDGTDEIVITDTPATLVYNAATFQLEWQADGMGGRSMAVGNIDNDLLPEIVVSGDYTGYILNASTQTQEWYYPGGFGYHLGLGDVDGDLMEEIAFIPANDYYRVNVLDGVTHTIQWTVDTLGDLGYVDMADADGDGISEVLVGNSGWGSVTGLDGDNGNVLWSISNPANGVSALAAADTNDDGDNEILWGGGFSFNAHGLLIGSWTSESVLWATDNLDGPFTVAAGDVDNDGKGEFVMASHSTRNDYGGGMLRVYDGATRRLEWSTLAQEYNYDLGFLAVAQLDSDPALEILVGGSSSYRALLQVYDGASHDLEWSYQPPEGTLLGCMTVKNIDADEIEEIIIGFSEGQVLVLNGASDVVDWDSGVDAFDSLIRDLSVGDLDGDGVMDLALVTLQSVVVVETENWSQRFYRSISGVVQVAIAEPDPNGGGELLLVTTPDNLNYTLQAWDAPDYATAWAYFLGVVTIRDLASLDVDDDSVNEFVVMGLEGISDCKKSLLWIGSRGYPSIWEYRSQGNWETIYNIALSDVDNDEQAEFLFGAASLFQVNEINIIQQNLHLAYLPFARKPCTPLYFDNFSDPASGWPVADTDTLLLEYTNGEYRILVRPKDSSVGVRPGIMATDFVLSVDVRNPNNVSGSYGLAFGIAADWSSLYTFEIYPDGWYGVYRFVPSSYTVLAEAYSPYINQGSASNEIKVERNGERIDVYANGNWLTSVYDSIITSQYLGLVVWSYDQKNVDIYFDNYTLYPVTCSSVTTPPAQAQSLQFTPDAGWFDLDLYARRR